MIPKSYNYQNNQQYHPSQNNQQYQPSQNYQFHQHSQNYQQYHPSQNNKVYKPSQNYQQYQPFQNNQVYHQPSQNNQVYLQPSQKYQTSQNYQVYQNYRSSQSNQTSNNYQTHLNYSRQPQVDNVPGPNFEDLDPILLNVFKSVCKIRIDTNNGSFGGSGFLLKSLINGQFYKWLVTNEHVITKEMINNKNAIKVWYNFED